MKKLLIILMFVPLVSFGQTKEELQLCLAAQSSNFTSDSEADNALDRILNVIGASKNFVLTPCSEINNAMATSYKGIRYILYDKAFMQLINSRTNDWASLAILAHEVGHHINGHALDITMYAGGVVEAASLDVQRKQELEADEFAGFILARLGATSDEALAFTEVFQEKDDTYDTHPSKSKRVASVTKGYTKAGGSSSVANNNSTPKEYVRDNENMSVEEYLNRGNERSDSEDYYGAIEDFSEVIRIVPDYASAYYFRGSAKNELNDLDGAIEDYSSAIVNKPDDADYYFVRGLTKLNYGSYYEALEDFTKAIELNPDNHAFWYYRRGDVKVLLKDYYGAIVDYSKSIEIEPNKTFFNAYDTRGMAKVYLKDLNGAVADYSKAIEIDPDDARLYFNRGLTKNSLKDYSGAIADYTKAIEIDSNYVDAYYSRGNIKTELEDYYGAISDYNKTIKLDPDYLSAYVNRGIYKEKIGDLNGACNDWRKAASLGHSDSAKWVRDECN